MDKELNKKYKEMLTELFPEGKYSPERLDAELLESNVNLGCTYLESLVKDPIKAANIAEDLRTHAISFKNLSEKLNDGKEVIL